MSNAAYFNLAIAAPRRLAMMRADFARHAAKNPHCPEHAKPKTWRDVRGFTLRNWQAAFCTFSAGVNQWYSHNGPEFRNERDAHEVYAHLDHGYYTNEHCDETAIGIVGSLSHGRFIAGYRWTSNDERVYFPQVFDDETDAARMADEHARVFADDAREHDERYNAAQTLQDEIDSTLQELADTRAEHSRMVYARQRSDDAARFIEFGLLAQSARDTAAELIATIRDKRETLETEFKGVL